MRVVEDRDGRRLVVVSESRSAVRVRDPASGQEEYLPRDVVTPVGPSSLEHAAGAVAAPVRRVIRGVHSDRMLGVLVVLHARGPMGVRSLLEASSFCESDFHGVLGELRAAGLIVQETVSGEPGYGLTEEGEAGIEALLTLSEPIDGESTA